MATTSALPCRQLTDSVLSRKYDRETTNYFSGSPLNRLSFLRSNHDFIGAAFIHPTTQFLCLKNLAPLATDPSRLAFVDLDQVKILTGQNPFQKSEEELLRVYNSTVTAPLVLFLGVDERKQEGFEYGIYRGKPYFAVDTTPIRGLEKEAASVVEALKSKNLLFLEGRTHTMLNASEAAIYAHARSLMDWNARNPFCSACGQPTISVEAGSKRACPPKDAGVPANPERNLCVTRSSISNVSFPRTDPTVIVAVISHSAKHILLGHQKRWPPHWYSTLAGFVESGESIEDAARREVWEESGVLIGQVVIHSSQTWPYPASLMIGAISQALPDGETIHLEHDPELEDAKWFGIDEVRQALDAGTTPSEEKLADGRPKNVLRLPPQTAIANQLLRAVLDKVLLVEESKI